MKITNIKRIQKPEQLLSIYCSDDRLIRLAPLIQHMLNKKKIKRPEKLISEHLMETYWQDLGGEGEGA